MSNRPRLLLTREQMRDRLLALSGATMVTFIGVTEPDWVKFKRGEKDDKGNKIPNPYIGRVVKVARINAQVNWTYDNAVINRSMKAISAERAEAHEPALSETDLRHEALRRFEMGESWMVPFKVEGKLTPFCIHKKDAERAAAEGIGNGVPIYLWVRCLSCLGVTFINTETGEEMSRHELAPFMAKESENAGANQGIENPDERIVPRAFGFSGIAELNTSGECWVNESWYTANATVRQAIETLAGTLAVPAA